MSSILLVDPNPLTLRKSRNHSNFPPIGLLKIATYLRDNGHKVKITKGTRKDINKLTREIIPEEIWITSLFTYWAKYVREAVRSYREMFPSAWIKVGGIYASLLPSSDVKEYTGCDEVHQGVIPEVEEHIMSHPLAYELCRHTDFQIVHASRGCPRKCPFCGTWKIEPEFKPKSSIRDEIQLPGVVFYDNNFLMNPHVENILDELVGLRRERKVKWVESQSGLDGRVLLKKPNLARMMKEAGFRYPRIAWDWGYEQNHYIERQIDVLIKAGYKSRGIFVFMLYNWQIPFEEMERKRIKCWEWQVQIADCRFRPLNQLIDEYRPRSTGQTFEDYFISEGWDDALVKQFRRNVRRQNICVRMRYCAYRKPSEPNSEEWAPESVSYPQSIAIDVTEGERE